jgi:hypothetical protein
MRYHFLRDHIKKGDITLEWTPTADQLADGLTKPLAAAAFDRFVRGIRLTDGLPDESRLSGSVGNQQPLTRHANGTACINTLCVNDTKVIGQATCKAIEPHADHTAACGS